MRRADLVINLMHFEGSKMNVYECRGSELSSALHVTRHIGASDLYCECCHISAHACKQIELFSSMGAVM